MAALLTERVSDVSNPDVVGVREQWPEKDAGESGDGAVGSHTTQKITPDTLGAIPLLPAPRRRLPAHPADTTLQRVTSAYSYTAQPPARRWAELFCFQTGASGDIIGVMYILTGLPTYHIAGLPVRPGDVLGRTKPGALIEHRVLVGFNGEIAHVPGPGGVFRPGRLEDILADGGLIRIVHPTDSLQESYRRFARAGNIMGVSWWNMNCHQTTDFIAALPLNPWLT